MHERFERRRFLKTAAAAGLGAALSAREIAAAPVAARAESARVISRHPALYHGWPTLARRRSGELLLVYSGGRESHICPFGRVELMRSRDDGRTWSHPQTLLDGPIDDRDAGVLETRAGTLLVTTFTSLAYAPILEQEEAAIRAATGQWPPERLERWRAAHGRLPAADRQRAVGVWMIRSRDGGVSWSAPYDSLVSSPHGPIELTDGRLLYAGKDRWADKPRSGVCESTDDGVSWRWLGTFPLRPGDVYAHYYEPYAVQAADGRIVCHIRNHNRENRRETLQTESSDGGRTWSVPHPIDVWGLPSHLVRLRDDRLLMSYGHRRPPYGNLARLSEDHGRSWSEPLVISDDGSNSDLGYPTSVELDDGSLLTVWYEVMEGSPRAVLRQRRWSLP